MRHEDSTTMGCSKLKSGGDRLSGWKAKNSDFRLATISGTCGGTRNGNSYTTNAINADCTVAASFTPILPGVEIPGAKIIKAISNSAEMRYAMDGRTDTIWNSGAPPQPTWIDIDLGGNYVVDTVALNPAQLPNGPSTHNIYVKTETGTTWVRIGTIQQYTSDGQWFKQSFPGQNMLVRYVAINTDNAGGPGSWVAWREIKVTARENQPVTYTITASAGTGGTISPPGTIAGVTSGSTRTFTVTPNAGYYISSISGCNGSTFYGNNSYTTARSYTTGAITANCTVSATFGQVVYTITTELGPGGTISPSGQIPVPLGATQVFTITPNAGYKISSVGGTCNGTLSGNTYTTQAITANCTVVATFVPTTNSPPIILNTNVIDITSSSATFYATSNVAATGYWLVRKASDPSPTAA